MEDRDLFRGKRTDNGEWVIGNRIDDGVTGQVFIHAVGNSVNESNKVGEDGCLQFLAFEVEPSTICRCIGIRDKNGTLIWENDILSGNLDDNFPEDETRKRVVWYENGWCTNETGCADYEELDDFDSENFEVIGNTVNNPELLEVQE